MARAAIPSDNVTVRELNVRADEGQLSRVRDFVTEVCSEAGFSTRETSNTKLAVDEACTNIIKHAYAGRPGGGEITVHAEISPGNLAVSLRDYGEPFDFAGVQDPDLDQYVETGRKGGLGVFLINRLMDGVEYHSSTDSNELRLTKRSGSAVSSGLLPLSQPVRGTLRFKFTMRAASGLFALILILGGFILTRQARDIDQQRTTQWVDKKRAAENLAGNSVELLLQDGEFSTEQTNVTDALSRLVENSPEIAWARVLNEQSEVVSSGNIDEMFTTLDASSIGGILGEDGRVTWRRSALDGRAVRDIAVAVELSGQTGQVARIGTIHLGVFEDAVAASVEDNRLTTALILLAVFAVGLFLIMGLVNVFVKPIQTLTDGVRAIGDGTTDKRLDISGPAEIGAIASVFNEITDKFKVAQDSILEQEKMQKEMEVAKEIQQSLLPRQKPEVSGFDIAPLYQAAAEVGGDYYDFVQVDDDTIGVVVADVSGKGVPGSLVMTMIRTALRMEARGNKNASDVMSKMNAFVTDDMKKGMFVTMFYVILDSKNRIISYASAGHNPMILYRHETHETYFLNPKGFPVGISLPDEELFRQSISLEKIKLKKDDMLLIYTDGVTEAMNENRDQYGEERLLGLIKEHGNLPPGEFIDKLEGDIKKFTAGHPQNDDITVVAVKEKLAADDVIYGIRKKLIDLVEVQGMNVKDACRQMKVSPATYYRYKKRLELMGERGLHNKVLRQDTTLKRVSLEARREILNIVAEHPEYGSKRIAEVYNEGKQVSVRVNERMVYEELKRLGLNTRDLRIEYLRRHKLLREEDDAALAGKDTDTLVEDLLRDIPGVEPPLDPSVGDDALRPASAGESFDLESLADAAPGTEIEMIGGVGLSVSRGEDGVVTIGVNGHLDSVTSTTLEDRLKKLITNGSSRIVIDLSDVTYISSGGWGIFTAEVRTLRLNDGDIVLVGMTSEVYDVYELLGFADVLRSFPNREDASAYFALPASERMAVPATPRRETEPEIEGAADDGAGSFGTASQWESLRIEGTTVGEKGDVAVLSLYGIIDTVSAEHLREAIARTISQGLIRIVVDLSEVEYVSSGGWGTFTERLREVRRAGGDIKLFGMDADVYYVFTMLGFNIVLSAFDILSDAVEDFGRHEGETDTRPTAPDGALPPVDLEPGTPTELQTGQAPAYGMGLADVGRYAEAPPAGPRPVQDVVKWEDKSHGVVVGRLHGTLESVSVEALSLGLSHVLGERPQILVFDLSDISYVSSTGWGQFARAYEESRSWGGHIGICGLRPDLFEIYSLLEFRKFLPVFETAEEALTALGEEAASLPPIADVPVRETPDAVVRDAGEIADATPVADESIDLGDVLGVDSQDPGSTDRPAIPSDASGMHHWPGESPPGEGEAKPVTEPETMPKAAPAGESARGRDRESADADVPPAGDVDVESAVADRNIDRDEKIRKLGWKKYGERLKGRREHRKKRDGDDEE